VVVKKVEEAGKKRKLQMRKKPIFYWNLDYYLKNRLLTVAF